MIRWLMIFIKFLTTMVMAIAFVVSSVILLNFDSINKSLPTRLYDLQKITITVKSAIISKSPQFITPVEYRTQFAIDGHLSAEVVSRHLVNAGDIVNVYVTLEELKILKDQTALPAYMQAYGITLQNGQQLVDPSQFLNGRIREHGRNIFTQIFSFSLIYFNCLIVWIVIRKQRANRSKRHTL